MSKPRGSEVITVSVRGSRATGLVHEADDLELSEASRERIARDAAILADELGVFTLDGISAIQDAMLAGAKRAIIEYNEARHAKN